jgi:predicted amidophosphoribosyltransferase
MSIMELRYFYTMEYLPTRYEASQSEWNNRRAVWNFKDGNCSSVIIDSLVNYVNHIVCGNKSDYVICFIPASTSHKTSVRYSYVARSLTERTGVQATLSAITKSSDSESGYIAGKSGNPTADFVFNPSYFRGKKVILIDDVITRGRTFTDTALKLDINGAMSVVGLFVAKTVNPDRNIVAA